MIKISSKKFFCSLCCYLAYIIHNIVLQEPNLKKCLEFLCNDVMNSFNANFFQNLNYIHYTIDIRYCYYYDEK